MIHYYINHHKTQTSNGVQCMDPVRLVRVHRSPARLVRFETDVETSNESQVIQWCEVKWNLSNQWSNQFQIPQLSSTWFPQKAAAYLTPGAHSLAECDHPPVRLAERIVASVSSPRSQTYPGLPAVLRSLWIANRRDPAVLDDQPQPWRFQIAEPSRPKCVGLHMLFPLGHPIIYVWRHITCRIRLGTQMYISQLTKTNVICMCIYIYIMYI